MKFPTYGGKNPNHRPEMVVSINGGTPKSSFHFNWIFHYKPSILGVSPCLEISIYSYYTLVNTSIAIENAPLMVDLPWFTYENAPIDGESPCFTDSTPIPTPIRAA